MKKVVKTDKAPGAIGPYSQGVDLGNIIFFSGQIPLNPKTGEMPEGIEAQTRQSLENVKGLLESQGLSFADVVKTTVFLDNMDDFATVNGIYAEYFVEPYPARSAVEVAKLPKGALIEVEVIVSKS
ncbi:RidA family protein [Candidatus Stoquefichus massiliensis]|uniref:RidA family protein n=1 Tax=Candidatus Stoquefichus massiliensis TaxID=1470350 RepID=UPI00048593F5|nr:RidA family protein [Candidatus Stoquefichus massiliensis]